MNCPNCMAPVTGEPKFCMACGAPLASQPKKKKHIGLWITIILILGIIAGVTYFIGSILFFSPKDLGVDYEHENYISAIEKTGLEITFDKMSGEELESFKDSLNGEKLDINDYNWEFSDYQQKSFDLTPEEATALLNEIAPAFWWFDQLQVNVENGVMEGSSKADISRLKRDLYSDIADQIPIPLPDKVNIYSKGEIEIVNNRLIAVPETFMLGAAPLPEEFMTQESVDVIAGYLERIYTVVPGLEINSLSADGDKFTFDGVIPQSVSVTPK